MKNVLAILLGFVSVACLSGCGKAPVYSSDAQIKNFVEDQLSQAKPNSKLSGFQVGAMKTEGDVDKKEFSAKVQPGTPGDAVAISGFVGYDKKAGARIYNVTYKYADSDEPSQAKQLIEKSPPAP